MTASKGGGIHVIDVPRTETITQLKRRLLDLFFEGEVNMAANVMLSDVKESFVGNFCQSYITLVADGEETTVEKYAMKVATSPIRVEK